jgi:hypothetical protein
VLCEQFRHTLAEANVLLGSDASDAEAWFALAKRAREQANELGVAVYCLSEWPEPDDASPDLDPDRRKIDPRRLVYYG